RSIDDDKQDQTPDSSILGAAVPFGIVNPKDPRMRRTVKNLEEALLCKVGMNRYQEDKYPKEGGVWPLCTAWLSWYYSSIGNVKRAEEFLHLVRKSSNEYGFLPEQIDEDFNPRWAVPLAWSHAMYVIARQSIVQLKRE
ncbi:MAG: glycoside hydrolase family 15 protein, partial [Candidatus Micrarchaeota archaeon]